MMVQTSKGANKKMKKIPLTGKNWVSLIFFAILIIAFIVIQGAVCSGFTAVTGPKGNLEAFWLNSSRQNFRNFPVPKRFEKKKLSKDLLAKAVPDECYNGMGGEYIPLPGGCTECEIGKSKVNEGYVWGLTKSGKDIWFGIAANVNCLAAGNFLGLYENPHENQCWVCEYSESKYPYFVPLLASGKPGVEVLGDWRVPKIYSYDTETGILSDNTPPLTFTDMLIVKTLGIRSAGSLGKFIILGGPSLTGGINLFAFHSDDGYLGSVNIQGFNNIRKWLALNGALYTAVGNSWGGGSVLRWSGTRQDPFQFEVVGSLDGSGAELAFHENRLFVSTWPDWPDEDNPNPPRGGLWMSPEIHEEGLVVGHTFTWEKVWAVDEYEPDAITASTYGVGALASFDGYLYWGTMHVPFLSTLMHTKINGTPSEPDEVMDLILGTHRAISIFRGRNFDSERKEIQLAYGMPYLPRYEDGLWQIGPNNMENPFPLWGLSGFGNFFNNYTWSMAVYQDRLYVGTMDWSFLFKEGLQAFLAEREMNIPRFPVMGPNSFFGADLFYLDSSNGPAFSESIDGIGNYTSYGIRNMVSDDALYLGMANPMNLLTDLNDLLPEGGWELIKLFEGP